jgi:hypothetical protein
MTNARNFPLAFGSEGSGGKIEKNEMDWACGANGGGERCAQGFGGEA